MIKIILDKALKGEDLTLKEAQSFIESILSGAETHQVAAILTLLRKKGETAEEIAGMGQAMFCHTIMVPTQRPVLDIVGTGGDQAHTVNISTGAAIVAAACGVPVAKHGNRAVSSKCGSADVLEELGICLNQTPEAISKSIEQHCFGFMFAPLFHPAMKVIAPIRQKLKIRTIFNLLGPLLNPSKAEYRLVGVCDSNLVEPIASALQQLGIKGAFVFHGSGLDELSPIGSAHGLLVKGDDVTPYTINPKELGLDSCSIEDLKGGDVKRNASILKEVLQGQPGPISDAIALNAACGMFIYGEVQSLTEGIELADEILKSGKAFVHLQKIIQSSNENLVKHDA